MLTRTLLHLYDPVNFWFPDLWSNMADSTEFAVMTSEENEDEDEGIYVNAGPAASRPFVS